MKTNVNPTNIEIKVRKPKKDIGGQKIGKLLVLHRDTTKIGKGVSSHWICQCDCGNIKSISKHSFDHGAKSCGCLQKESAMNLAIPNAGADRKSWINKYKRRAKDNGVEFSLTDEQFYDICSKRCFYCNVEPSLKSHGYKTKKDVGKYLANGIDRKDPNIGYVFENCLPCCKICNFMKTNKSLELFLAKIFEIADNIRKK